MVCVKNIPRFPIALVLALVLGANHVCACLPNATGFPATESEAVALQVSPAHVFDHCSESPAPASCLHCLDLSLMSGQDVPLLALSQPQQDEPGGSACEPLTAPTAVFLAAGIPPAPPPPDIPLLTPVTLKVRLLN